jgi:integrase
MDDQHTLFNSRQNRDPWNKGKFTGAKPPLRPKHVWSIRSKLQAEGQARDLAMFNLAIDSKLRACNVVALKVEDVAPNDAANRATIRQKKTGQPVRFELTEQTRQAVDEYLKATGKKPGDFMFSGQKGAERAGELTLHRPCCPVVCS